MAEMAEHTTRFGIGVSNTIPDIAQTLKIITASDQAALDHFSASALWAEEVVPRVREALRGWV